MKLFSVGLFLLVGCGAMNASIIFTIGNNPQVNEENVLFNLPGLIAGPAFTVTGETSASNFLVNFTSGELLVTPSAGQARVQGADGDFTDLGINLGTATFTDIIFNLNTLNATPGTANITVTQKVGPSGTFTLPVAQGSNFLTITTDGGSLMTGVSILTTVQTIDIRQTRISGAAGGSHPAAVPEPATYLMLGGGLLAIAALTRRRLRA